MRCERALELISARIDCEIIFEDDRLDEHLQNCTNCRNEMENLRRLDATLSRAYQPERDAAEVLIDKVKGSLEARGRRVRPCTLLIVDDDPQILMLFHKMLADEFFVITAKNGKDAQSRFSEREIDIVLADQIMPQMTGVELLEWVLAHHPRTQRLLWSGGGEFQGAIDAINRGQIFRYLTKPADNEVVLSAVKAAAQMSQLEKEYHRVLREVTELNVQLEARVKQRTRELEEAIQDLELQAQILEKFALTDGLTLLPNRKALNHFVERELYMCRRFPAPLAVAVIDVDFFKAINTKYEHSGGDQVLCELANCMSKALRKIDMLGRWAGDEFMLIAPQTQRAGAIVLAERLRSLVEKHQFCFNGERIPLTVTVGVAVLEAGRAAEVDQVIYTAASALNRAKAQGRNCVEFAAVAAAITNDRALPDSNRAASA